MKNGIYKCVTEKGNLAYIGSSGITLEKLESNHRNYFKYPDGHETKFRRYLRQHGKDWKFSWIIEPYECSKKEIELKEGNYIRSHPPLFNVDKNPVRSSIKYGRYE